MTRGPLVILVVAAAVTGVGAGGLAGEAAQGPHALRTRSGRPPFAVGETQMTFVDPHRTIAYPGRPRQPRSLTTIVRYPIAGPADRMDVRGAAPDRADGPFPLVVFGHGFAVTPATYYRLLRAVAQAGYVVAAPVFPLEQAHAPGGPDEADLVNQPRDMSLVISRMIAASADRHAPLWGMVDRRAIAVSGQSDGGETALAVAYDRYYRDPRVRAAAIFSGAQIPGAGTLLPGPPLLAVQGTDDTINNPINTYSFFGVAHRPKYLLRLFGAPHLPPYTVQQPQLSIVERVTVAFLDRYLKGERGATRLMAAAGNRRAVAGLEAEP